MQDLYQFPYFEIHQNSPSDKEIQMMILEHLQLQTKAYRKLLPVTHTFTRYSARLQALHLITKQPKAIEGMQWQPFHTLHNLAFSAGHKKLLLQLTL